MKTFYQIFSIQIDTVLSEYTTKQFAIITKHKNYYGMTFFANTMASRIFFTEEVVLFSFFSWKTWKQNLIIHMSLL